MENVFSVHHYDTVFHTASYGMSGRDQVSIKQHFLIITYNICMTKSVKTRIISNRTSSE